MHPALRRLGILVTFLCSVKYTDASLVVTLSANRSVYLTDGESLELVCEINQDVGPSGVWFMKDDHIRIWLRNPSMCEFDKTINSDLSMYNMICKHPRRYSLVIHRINVSDHKTTWKCSIASKEGGRCFGVNNPCIIPVTTVRLTDDSGLPLYSPVTVENGSRTNFTCDTSPSGSRPSALFRWYKRKDGQISNVTEDQSVSFTSAMKTMSGEPDADLLISYNTLSLSFEKSYQNISVICAAQDRTNTGTNVQSLEVQINIVYPPVVTIFPNRHHIKVKEGSHNFILTCHVNESNPKEYQDGFAWLHNGKVIQDEKSSSYMIQTVQKFHDGRYQCKANNSYGIGSSEAVMINVQYVAKITDLSVATSDILNENDTAILRCFVDSNPESSITWRKEGHGGHLKTDLYTLQSQLVFNCVQCLDASNYTCEASNGLGSPVERRISLHVNCHPRTDFRSPSVTKVYSKLRGDAALTYTVISYPDPKFEWIFTGNGSEIKALPYSATQKDEYRTSTLIFTNLDVKDFGFYSVIAINPFPPAATCVFELIIAEGNEIEMRLSLVGIVAVIVVLTVVAIVVFRVKRSRYRNGTARQQGKQSSQSDDNSAEIRPVITNSVRVIEVTGEHECLQLKANESPYLEVYDVEPDYSTNINSRLPGGENYESLHIYSNNLDQTYCCVKPPQRQALNFGSQGRYFLPSDSGYTLNRYSECGGVERRHEDNPEKSADNNPVENYY